ncbi:hypothetical protein ACF1CY_003288 [Providencia rettgeri]
MSEASDKADLHRQLIRLGDMMGDGLHHEPDGKWISKEYRRVAKALGYDMPAVKRQSNPAREQRTEAINQRMQERVRDVPCQKCGGVLKQIRSGSVKANCEPCGIRYTLLTVQRKKSR